MSRFSIIVPVYNVERYLPRCIESLCNQTLTDIEIILVDDGSPDNSGKICDDYAAKDVRIKVIHKKNEGVSAARNDGLLSATGEYVLFCDSDDWMEATACNLLYEAGIKNDADVVIGDVNQIFGEKLARTYFYNDEFVTDDRKYMDDLIRADFCKKYCPNPYNGVPAFGYGGPWNKAVKREMLVDNKITFDIRVKGIFDDIIYTAYILAVAKKVVYIQIPVYNYRILNTSITHTYKSNLLDINKAIFESWTEFIDRYGNDGRFHKAFYANVIRRLKSTLGLYYFNKNNSMSFGEQCYDLKKLIDSEPYKTAIENADYNKLANKFDQLVWKMARNKSVLGLYIVYRISIIAHRFKK
jgi:glycosyltransferase involved in cell wall biosynthesis